MKELSSVMEIEPSIFSARAQLLTHLNKDCYEEKQNRKSLWSFLLQPNQGRI